MSDKILITGATGFIGSHLAEMCVEKGFNVVAFDRYNPNNNWGWLENSKYNKDMRIVLGDIRDYDSVFKSVKGCNKIFHLAALVGIPYSYLSPIAYIKTNLEGTYNVVESAKKFDIDQIIITSTSETYGSAKYIPIDEKHDLVGQSPYAASKIAADQLALSYHFSYNLPIKIVKPFNTFGPRQSLRAIIPTIISQALYNDKITLGNTSPSRDFLYVEDTCRSFLEISKSKKLLGEVINVGTKTEISIEKLTKKILKIMDLSLEIKKEKTRSRPKKSEVDRLCCDNKKIIKLTKWKPNYSLDEGLRKTIDWFKDFHNSNKKDIYHI